MITLKDQLKQPGSPWMSYQNFNFQGTKDRISHEFLPAANYEGAHQSLDKDGNLVNYTKDEYVRSPDGQIWTRAGWKESCLRSTNPLLWVKAGALDIAAAAAGNVGAFANAGKITDDGAVTDRYLFWQSATSGAPTGIQFVQAYYVEDTSGEVRITFANTTAGTESVYAGAIGAATVTSEAAGALTLVSDVAYLDGRLASFLINFTTKANVLTMGIGPNSVDGGAIIARGASVASAVGTGDITSPVPFTETAGSVITLSSLRADLTNGRGPRYTLSDTPKLSTALQGTGSNAVGQLEWTGTTLGSGVQNGLIACSTARDMVRVETDGSLTVQDGVYSGSLAAAVTANTETKLILPYQSNAGQIIVGSGYQIMGFNGNFGPGTTFGIGTGPQSVLHKGVKFFKRARTDAAGVPLMQEVYSATISGILISTVNLTAFLDTCAAITEFADGNHLVEISDVNNKKIIGVAGAVGTGETVGSELVVNGTFSAWTGDNPDNWTVNNEDANNYVTENPAGSANLISDGSAAVNFLQSITSTVGGLVKLEYDVAGTAYQRTLAFLGESVSSIIPAFTGSLTVYGNFRQNSSIVLLRRAGTTTNVTFDDVSIKQVLTPSTSGLALLSDRLGAVQSPMYTDSAFVFNASSYGVKVFKMLGA